jgi:hypothetical protein
MRIVRGEAWITDSPLLVEWTGERRVIVAEAIVVAGVSQVAEVLRRT